MKSNTDIFYAAPNDYLAQGDIFRIDLVGPYADEVKRIFRTTDGRHGSVFFEGNCPAKIFSQEDLESLLETTRRTELHIDPFSKTRDGQAEMVVVPAELFQYFIVATNTCDISGVDGPPKCAATILPVITLASMCKRTPLTFRTVNTPTTIHSFVTQYCPKGEALEVAGDLDYSTIVRLTINEWIESNIPKKLRQDVAQIKNFLMNYHSKGYMSPLPQNMKYGLPESYVDFTTVLTVPRDKLLEIKEFRFVRIADRYCDNFARKFGDFFSRLALLKQMRPS